MPTFLSPGVFPREIDLSVNAGNVGPLRPVFVGAAQKGPMNVPTFVTSAQQAIDMFGNPFPESYLMYAVLAYMEEGNQAYIVRVGVECLAGQASELDAVCIDLSGERNSGWGRIALFTGIDYGRINMRAVDSTNPIEFHAASVDASDFTDADTSVTDGQSKAKLNYLSAAYTGCLDENYIVLITGDPDDGFVLKGATYEVIRNSDDMIWYGVLNESGTVPDTSDPIDIDDGIIFNIEVLDGRLATNDTLTFAAHPDNRTFNVEVEGVASNNYTINTTGELTTATAVVNAINAAVFGATPLVGPGPIYAEDYQAVVYTDNDGVELPEFRTLVNGHRIQLMSSCAFAAEVGLQSYAYDIPRSYLIGTDIGPFTITSQNNRISIDVIPEAGATTNVVFTILSGTGLTAEMIAPSINAAGTVGGVTYFESFALTVPGGASQIVIATNAISNMFDQLRMMASYSNLKTLRFAEEIGIAYPYTRSYRGFYDGRLSLPATGELDPATPLSCELSTGDCASDTAYFLGIVGWFVAVTPGTWSSGYKISVEIQTAGPGDPAGRYQIAVKDNNNVIADLVQNVSFDKTDARYIANVVNPGSVYGGTNGNDFYNWEERPAFLNNDPTDTTTYQVRQPAQIYRALRGGANGIPLDPALSSELDAAIIGNPDDSTGLYSVQNAETFDINLLVIPGFSSGSVIGQGLQLCQSRGDALYIVDPPFGLRPQQVVDWHNGMLTSDFSNAINSSYGALYWSWLKIYDQFTKQDLWIPPSGHVASVFARTARVAEQWYAPAGLRRGRLLTPISVEYNPSQGERDLLYGSGNAVNPLVAFPQDGITVFGNRTLQRADTALNRVNVRMLLIYLKKNLVQLLRPFVFEPNDTTAWAQVNNVVNPFLADVQARRGLDGFKCVCDGTNNTPERRQRNQLWVSVFIKPTPAIEFIVLNLVILQTTASFNSEEVLAAGGVVFA